MAKELAKLKAKCAVLEKTAATATAANTTSATLATITALDIAKTPTPEVTEPWVLTALGHKPLTDCKPPET